MVVQGHRVNHRGEAVYEPLPIKTWVRLSGRQWAFVPDGHDPATVRAEWFAKANLPVPNNRVETMETDA